MLMNIFHSGADREDQIDSLKHGKVLLLNVLAHVPAIDEFHDQESPFYLFLRQLEFY